MQSKDLMLSLVYTCRPNDSVQACAQLMESQRIGLVPIIEKGRVAGVVTDRDLALRVIGTGRPNSTRVREVMTWGPFVTCTPDEDLHSVEAKMARGKKSRILVVDGGGRCVGIISLSDIARVEKRGDAGQLLKNIVVRESAAIMRA